MWRDVLRVTGGALSTVTALSGGSRLEVLVLSALSFSAPQRRAEDAFDVGLHTAETAVIALPFATQLLGVAAIAGPSTLRFEHPLYLDLDSQYLLDWK